MAPENSSDKVIHKLVEIKEAVQSLDARVTFGLKQLALVPVAVTCSLSLSWLLWNKTITEWTWGCFMVVVMFPYFSDGLKYIFEKVPMFKPESDRIVKSIIFLVACLGLTSCVSYTYPIGKDAKYGSIHLTAKYTPPSFSYSEILEYNRNIQQTLKDK